MINDEFIMFFENTLHLKRRKEEPIVRNDGHLFTFSPVEAVIDDYKNTKTENCYLEQMCFRNVYPYNKYNPLSVPLQKLFSIHMFQKSKYYDYILDLIQSFFVNQLHLEQNNIYLMIPEIDGISDGFKHYHNLIIRDPNRLKCNLPIEGTHYYVKVLYHYKRGLVTIANFVLLDYKKELHQLDSVFYPDRVNMILENKTFIYNQQKYQPAIDILRNNIVDCKPQIQHFILSNITAICYLYSELGEINSKRHGYVIKKLIRELFSECYMWKYDVPLIINEVFSLYNSESTFINRMMEEYDVYINTLDTAKRNIEKKVSKTQMIDKELFEQLYSTYGVQRMILSKWLTENNYILSEDSAEVSPKLNYAFFFETEKNQIDDPILQYV